MSEIFSKFPLSRSSKLLLLLALSLTTLAVGYWFYLERYPETDDAYLKANIIQVAPEVSGKVQKVLVENHQEVKPGDLLVELDKTPFAIAVQAAKAKYQQATEQLATATEHLQTLRELRNQKQAQYVEAERNYLRLQQLRHASVVSQAALDGAKADFDISKAAVSAANKQLAEAKARLGQVDSSNSMLQQAAAELARAELNLKRTQLYANTKATVNQLSIRPGSLVRQHQIIMSLVEAEQWWVEANYKETQLHNLRPGQTAHVTLDMYPGVDFRGKVTSISNGSGSSFSLLPPENATGNWVKITQRFPVKIAIQPPSEPPPLRVGASATVQIDTTSGKALPPRS